MTVAPDNKTVGPRPRASDILRSLISDGAGDRLTLGAIEAALGERSFGVLLLVLALLGMLPGVSMAAAVAMVPVCVQMICGASSPWLPSWLRRRSVKRSDFAAFVQRVLPALVKLEQVLRPRYRHLTVHSAERLVGAMCLVLVLFLLPPLPIPFSNIPFALLIAVLALAIIERDGLLAAVGLCGSATLVGGTIVLGWVALEQVLLLAAKYFGM
jgi:hypothetical protein